jgi:hypothetical protein
MILYLLESVAHVNPGIIINSEAFQIVGDECTGYKPSLLRGHLHKGLLSYENDP